MIGRLAAVTRLHFTATSTAWVQRARARERFAFPAALAAPDLPTPPPLTDAERAEAQRWALELSQIADPEARQATLATAPVHWQATIRHYLAWRLGMAALRATLRKAEPATEVE